LEFRAQGQSQNQGGPWRWLELRATIVCEQDEPSDCLGLISDITQRKEAEFAQPSAVDPLTGLGNRVALMQALDGLAGASSPVLLALLDVDRFKAIHASLGDHGADTMLKLIAERVAEAGEPARLFRVGGDSFAFVFTRPTQTAQAIGNALTEACAK